jgi:hypothetical protein
MEKIKYRYYYPENIELRKQLRKGDIALIAKASKKSRQLINMVYQGTRKMKPEVRQIHDTVVLFNKELETALGIKLDAEQEDAVISR